jgi:hypothetical protein
MSLSHQNANHVFEYGPRPLSIQGPVEPRWAFLGIIPYLPNVYYTSTAVPELENHHIHRPTGHKR